MLAAWKEIEGAGCCCHREQNCLKSALSVPEVVPLIKKVKGACAHFHRTHKVSLNYSPNLPICHVYSHTIINDTLMTRLYRGSTIFVTWLINIVMA